MHPGGVPSAMDLFDFEKSANLKHPSVHTKVLCHVRSRFCVKCEKFVYTSAATDASDKYQVCLYQYGTMASLGLGWNCLVEYKEI